MCCFALALDFSSNASRFAPFALREFSAPLPRSPSSLRSCDLVGPSRFELPASRLSGVRSNLLSYGPLLCGGDERNRTADPLLAKQVLSQLSYTPLASPSIKHTVQKFPQLLLLQLLQAPLLVYTLERR